MKLVTAKFKSGGLHEKHVVATWNLGNHLSICFWSRETKKNLCRDGRSHDLGMVCALLETPVATSTYAVRASKLQICVHDRCLQNNAQKVVL